jgi:hypothetical protein
VWRFITVSYFADGNVHVYADGQQMPAEANAWYQERYNNRARVTGLGYTSLVIGNVAGAVADLQVYDYVLSPEAMAGLAAGNTTACRILPPPAPPPPPLPPQPPLPPLPPLQLVACPDVAHRLTATASSVSRSGSLASVMDTGVSPVPWNASLSRPAIYNAAQASFVFNRREWGISILATPSEPVVIGSASEGATIAFWWRDGTHRTGCGQGRTGTIYSFGVTENLVDTSDYQHYYSGAYMELSVSNGCGPTSMAPIDLRVYDRFYNYTYGARGNSGSAAYTVEYEEDPDFVSDGTVWRFISVAYSADGNVAVYADGQAMPDEVNAWYQEYYDRARVTGLGYTSLVIGNVAGAIADLQVYDYVGRPPGPSPNPPPPLRKPS